MIMYYYDHVTILMNAAEITRDPSKTVRTFTKRFLKLIFVSMFWLIVIIIIIIIVVIESNYYFQCYVQSHIIFDARTF